MTIDDSILHTDDFYVACVGSNPAKLDMSFVVNSLLNTYFGSWRSREVIEDSIKNSICFGVWRHAVDPHLSDRQVGFARVVTDLATFSWCCDVFIDPKFQKLGLGSFLMAEIIKNPCVANRACYLSTRDKHEFYKKFGFIRQGEGSNVMRRLPTKMLT